MKVHLVDGTYELFRHFFAMPSARNNAGAEVAATRGVIGSLLGMLENDTTHIAVATDHVVESFRNQLYDGYKDGSGIDPSLFSQFELLETALEAAGMVVWRMVEFEADDGLAAGALMASETDEVEQVVICTPDKDLAQCVVEDRVVQLDRRRRKTMNAAAVLDKFGVEPCSIPDYLALVGDSADGFPGLKGWGPRSASTVLRQFKHLDLIPPSSAAWGVSLRGATRLAQTLSAGREDAELFRTLATLRTDAPVSKTVADLRWRGSNKGDELIRLLDAPDLARRVQRLSAKVV